MTVAVYTTRPTILDLQKTSFLTDVPGDRAEGPGMSDNRNSLMIDDLPVAVLKISRLYVHGHPAIRTSTG